MIAFAGRDATMGLPHASRLRARSAFDRVRREGKRLSCGPFVFQLRAGRDAGPGRRFGVIASRRVGSAVRRNRGKRVFREICRRNADLLPDPCELVIVLRSGFERHAYADLEARFVRACRACQKMAAEEAAGEAR